MISLSVSNAGFLCCSQDISQGFRDLETKLVFEDPFQDGSCRLLMERVFSTSLCKPLHTVLSRHGHWLSQNEWSKGQRVIMTEATMSFVSNLRCNITSLLYPSIPCGCLGCFNTLVMVNSAARKESCRRNLVNT